jgi:glycosyltransferase involved in cell wall biosynthesis
MGFRYPHQQAAQAVCWAGKWIPTASLEIAVAKLPLTPAEQKAVLEQAGALDDEVSLFRASQLTMRIAILGFSFSAIGGLEIVSKAIGGALARRGHRVECLALHESGQSAGSEGIEVVGLAPRTFVTRSLSHRFPGLLSGTALRRHLRDTDVVITAHAHALKAAMPVIDRLPSRPTVVCWLHGREVWAKLGTDIAPQLRRVDHMVAVSHFTAETVRTLLSNARPITVIYNPVDTDIFTPASSPSDICRHHILTVGRHDHDSRHKGYAVLIEAMKLLRRKRPDLPLRLTITGFGPLIAEHRRQVVSLALEDVVSCAGRVSRSKLRSLYQTADIFAFPSRHESAGGEEYGEGFGVVNAEAAACGRPVLTSTHGGCLETVLDGVTGFAVDPTSPEAVALKIAALFDMSPNDRDAMGARGRAMAVERFSIPVFEQRVGKFVESCAARPALGVPLAGASA